MQTSLWISALKFLDQVAYWANYKVYLGGPDHLTIPLALIGILAGSLLVLIVYSITERYRRNE